MRFKKILKTDSPMAELSWWQSRPHYADIPTPASCERNEPWPSRENVQLARTLNTLIMTYGHDAVVREVERRGCFPGFGTPALAEFS